MPDSSSGSSPLPADPAPCNKTLKHVDDSEVLLTKESAEHDIHHFYVPCTELKDAQLPLDANPRAPEVTTQVKAMKDTLQNDPSEFIERNNGIVVLASSVNHRKNSFELCFEEGEGVCNGGHTLLAIHKYTEHEEALAHLEVIELDSLDATDESRQKRIADIADARNNNNQLEERSEANFLGYYDHFKDQLVDRHLVHWHEGDPDAIDKSVEAYQFFRLLKSLDVKNYGHPLYDQRGKNHSSLATSVTRIHNRWKSNMDDWQMADDDEQTRPLQYLTPLVNDVLFIRDLVSHHFQHQDFPQGTRRKSIFQDYIKSDDRPLIFENFENSIGFKLTPPFEVLMVGLFRTNLYVSSSDVENAKLVGWIRDPQDLFEQRSLAVLNNLQADYKDGGQDPKNFIRLNGPFTHDFYSHGMGQTLTESPQHIYQVESGQRYTKVEDWESATHGLIVNRDPNTIDKLHKAENSPSEAKPYRVQELTEAFHYTSSNN